MNFANAGFAVALLFLAALNDHIARSTLPPLATAVAFLYPVGWFSAAAFGAICLVLYTAKPRRPPTRLLVFAAATQASADLIYGLALMEGSDTGRTSANGLWIASFTLFLWASFEHLRKLRNGVSAEGEARSWHAEAFIPAVAIGIVGGTWSLTSFTDQGVLVALPGAAAAAMAAFLGLREHLMLRNERSIRMQADESRRNLEAVLESTTDSVVVLDLDWNIIYRNSRASSLVGVRGFDCGVKWDCRIFCA